MNIKNSLRKFLTLVDSGAAHWQTAGELLVAMKKQEPKIYQRIMASDPRITMSMLLAFEAVGRKELHPLLFMDSSVAAKKVAAFPYSTQEKCLTEPIPVCRIDGGEVKTEYKRLREITGKEAKLAFTDTGIRPIKKQRELLEAPPAPRFPRVNREGWEVRNEGVFFRYNTFCTWDELKALVKRAPSTEAKAILGRMQQNQVRMAA